MSQSQPKQTMWKTAPTRRVDAAGSTFVYRQLGPAAGVPVVLPNHWGATLDNFDPRLAAVLPAIALGYRGVDGPGGKAINPAELRRRLAAPLNH